MESLQNIISLIGFVAYLSGKIILDEYLATIYLIGSFASIIGIPLALIGVFLSYRAAKKSALEAESSKDASLFARSEVEKFRNDIKLLAQVVDFERALNIMDDIKLFMRSGIYRQVPERISSLILLLNKVRSPSMGMSDENSAVIQESVTELRKIEEFVERFQNSADFDQQTSSLNRRISNQIDKLYPIMNDLKNQIGELYEPR